MRETRLTEWEINKSDISLCGENTHKSFSPCMHFILFDRGECYQYLKLVRGFPYPRMQWKTPISAIGSLLCVYLWHKLNFKQSVALRNRNENAKENIFFFFSRSESCWEMRWRIVIIVRVSRCMLKMPRLNFTNLPRLQHLNKAIIAIASHAVSDYYLSSPLKSKAIWWYWHLCYDWLQTKWQLRD